MRPYVTSVIVVSLVAVLVSAALAQSRPGYIHGIIRDRAGTALIGVEVKLSRGVFQAVQTTRTDLKGEFSFRNLEPGSYTISAALSGFRPLTVTAFVQAGITRELTLQMEMAVAGKEAGRESPPAKVEGGVAGGIAGGIVGGLPAVAASNARAFSPYGPFNTEAYNKVDDNQWTEALRKPLSTFSIDVDTASYANVRRFLHEGRLPPKDAVRIEELVNYFSFDYPEPRRSDPFAVTTALAAAPWNPRHRLALIGLQARRLETGRTPPRNLVFLIDVSGSMQSPDKLPLVKSSLALLARTLTHQDRIAIAVYAGAAGLVLPATRGDDVETVLEAIGRLEAGGSTNGAQGILLAYRTAREGFIRGGINRVILATDGDFNVGVTNQGDLIRLIEEQRESGVMLSVLGYGRGNLKDSTMEQLADRGNGNYAYIDTMAEARKVLVEQAGGTLVTVAKDVKLQVEFNPQTVAAYRLIGYENRVLQDQDFNDDQKDAGDLGAGHSVTALYEIVPVGERIEVPGVDPLKYQRPPASSGAHSDELVTVKLRYKLPEAETSTLMSTVIKSAPNLTPQLGFAAAVAEFGMLLRDSEFKGSSSYPHAMSLAQRFKGEDLHGHRAEFIQLIGLAERLGNRRPD